MLRNHLLTAWRMSLGDSVDEVAEMVGYSHRWIREIARRYKFKGVEGLVDRRHSDPGAKDRALLDEAREAEIIEMLSGPTPSCVGEWCGAG